MQQIQLLKVTYVDSQDVGEQPYIVIGIGDIAVFIYKKNITVGTLGV